MTQAEQDALQNVDDIEKYFLGSLLSGGSSDPKAGNSLEAWTDLYDGYQRHALKTRLAIPLLYGIDAVHGHNNVLGAVIFPHNIGLGCTRNPRLVEGAARITAEEVRATGINWAFAPCVTVPRDERWGRTYEGFGENPELARTLGEAAVRGLQTNDLGNPLSVLACAKHYVGDGGTSMGTASFLNPNAKSLLDQGDTRLTEGQLREIHMQGYLSTIKAGVGSIMPSYNSLNGVKVSRSKRLLTDILKAELGFEGFLISDYNAIDQIDKDYKHAIEISINAGMDMAMVPRKYREFHRLLVALVKEGGVPMSVLDDRVRDVLRVKFWEGLFDQPYRPLTNVDETVLNQKNLDVARQTSRECLVLLKNENNLLPLDASKIKTIAICGPNADNEYYAKGHYGPNNPDVITLRHALEKRFAGKATVLYTKGCDFFDANWPDTEIMREPPTAPEQTTIDLAVADAKRADVAIIVVGDMPRGLPRIRSTVGEDSSRTGLDLSGRQDDLIRAVAAVGKPTIVINISGRPVALNWVNRLCPAIIQAFFPGMFGGDALADALFGDYNPGGKLTCTFPKSAGQLPMNFPAKPAANDEPTNADRVNIAGLLWPFGHGLSYTTFGYSDLKLQPERQSTNGNITATFKLTNIGAREGDEIPQLYIRQEVSSVTTWEKRLCGFDRVHLQPGESKVVTLTIAPENLAIWNREMKRIVEPGMFKVMVGASSADIRLHGEFEITAQN